MCACSSYYPIENALLAFVMPTQTGFFVVSYYLIESTVLVFVNHSAYGDNGVSVFSSYYPR